MFYIPELLRARAESYCKRANIIINPEPLGTGLQGMVFKGSNQSAIKVHNERAGFDRELAAYGRLQHFKVTEIAGLAVPSLMGFESELKIIEISIVSPPYLLDFGGAHLDEAPSHIIDSDAKQRWMEERLEKFAESTPLVNRALAELERKYGVFLTDIHPGNIRIV